MRIAVIDMGTNTFNLLIADACANNFTVVFQNKLGVMLGKGGINKSLINDSAYSRGLKAIQTHLESTRMHEVETSNIKAFATSAIRSAQNGHNFVHEIRTQYGIDVEIIDGNREAELIYKGVNASMHLADQKALIMDIGGGSNEFIICDSQKIYWKQSFPLGMSRLLDRFSPSDPISKTEIAAIESYLTDNLSLLWNAVVLHKPTALIGSSGSFDTYRNVLYYGKDNLQHAREFILEEYLDLHQLLLDSSLQQRLQMKGMDELRAEMIVLASILTNLVLDRTGIRQIMQSNFALKEGAIVEMLANQIN